MSPVMRNERRPGVFTSRCGELIVRGHPGQIAAKYDEQADLAMKNKAPLLAETYRQHAHHWRSVSEFHSHAKETQ